MRFGFGKSHVDIEQVHVKRYKSKDKFITDHLALFAAIGVNDDVAKEKLSTLWDSQHPKKKEDDT